MTKMGCRLTKREKIEKIRKRLRKLKIPKNTNYRYYVTGITKNGKGLTVAGAGVPNGKHWVTVKFPKVKRKTKRVKVVPLPKLIKKADLAFSKHIRERDKGCVLSDGKCKGAVQCGHLIRRGKHSVRFDEVNCHGQCQYHNFLHNQYPEIYTNWFIREYGQSMYEDLVDRSRKIKQFTREELSEIIRKYETPRG